MVSPIGGDLAREIKSLKKLLGGLMSVGVVGFGTKFTYDTAYAPKAGAAEVFAIKSLEAEMKRVNDERIAALKDFGNKMDESNGKLWDKYAAVNSGVGTNAQNIAILTTQVSSLLSVTAKHEDRIHEIEMESRKP